MKRILLIIGLAVACLLGLGVTVSQTPFGGVPLGGLAGQILYKSSNTNYDATWGPIYAENSFVPVVTLVGGTGNTVPVYSTNSGTWTRIGRLVFWNVQLSGDGGAEGAGSGQMTITLPFTPGADQLLIRIPCGTAINGAHEDVLFYQITAATATMTIYKDNVTASDLDLVPMTGADQNNATRAIYISGKLLL